MNVNNDRTGIAQRIWLLMLKEGGRWSAAEIADKLNDHTLMVSQNVASMVEFGSVCRYEKTTAADRVRFGITPDCKIPRGVSISDILACDLQQVAQLPTHYRAVT